MTNQFESLRILKKSKKSKSLTSPVIAPSNAHVPALDIGNEKNGSNALPPNHNVISQGIKYTFQNDTMFAVSAGNDCCTNNLDLDNLFFVKLSKDQYFVFCGLAQVSVVAGSCLIDGYRKTTCVPSKLYSCTLTSLIRIENSQSLMNNSDIALDFVTNQKSKRMAEKKCSEWINNEPDCCIIYLSQLDDGIQDIQTMIPALRSCWGKSISPPIESVPLLCDISPETEELMSKKITISKPGFCILPTAEYHDAMNFSTATAFMLSNLDFGVHCVVGPQNSGKSTTCKFLANSILSRSKEVAYLDCDLGLPELTPCGILSLSILTEPLFGPNFSHLRTPLHSRYFGSISAKNNPVTYNRLLCELIEIYQTSFKHLELVVNTSGWVKGVGLDLLQSLLQVLQPTNILLHEAQRQTNSEHRQQNIDTEFLLRGIETVNVFKIEPFSSSHAFANTRPSAGDWRNASMLCYLLKSPDFQGDVRYDLLKPPSIPYKIPLSNFSIKFLDHQVPFSQSFLAMNGMIVGLVVDKTDYHETAKPSGNMCRFIPTNTPLHQGCCIGLGLIRAFDLKTKLVYISTSAPVMHLNKVNLLVRGDASVETPLALAKSLYNWNSVSNPCPYLTNVGAVGIGSLEYKNRHLGRKK